MANMASSRTSSLLIHVGTCFGDDKSPTKAILRFSLDATTGALSEAGPPIQIENGVNPGWLSRYVTFNNQRLVYVAMEDDPGTALSFRLVDDNGFLEPFGDYAPTRGKGPCYGQLDKTGKWLLCAHYFSGDVSVVSVQEDGSLGRKTTAYQKHEGRPVPKNLQDRQEGPHAHCIVPHPSNQYAVACDLGLSAVFVYGFDASKGTLTKSGQLELPIDAGCRHCCWDATGETLFVTNELNYTITAASFDKGVLKEVASVNFLREGDPLDRNHHRGGSDLAIHPNGNFLYVGCRSTTPGLIAILSVKGKGCDCKLTVLGHESSRGEVPRNFKLLAGGKWMVVGNQEGKNVVSYAVDSDTGKLEFKSKVSTEPYKACNIASPHAIYA